MGDIIQMDGLSRGAKPKGNDNEKIARGAPGGQVFNAQNRNNSNNVINFPGGAKKDEKLNSPVKENSPAGSVTSPSKGNGKLNNFQNKAGSMMKNASPKNQKALQKKLKQLQKAAPELSKKMSRGPAGMASIAMDFAKQVHPTSDWFFLFILFPAALLKDILDFALNAIPIAGPAIGIVFSYVGSVAILMLTIVALLLSGSDIKNRGLAKYIFTLIVGFIAENIPGLDILPITFIEVILAYGLTIFDRAMDYYVQKSEGKDSAQSESSAPGVQAAPEPQYADQYADRKAA
jgi:hypothetical protein